MLTHVNIDKIIDDSDSNLLKINDFCSQKLIKRIYSRWYNLKYLYEMLHMLGYTTEVIATGPHDIRYRIKTWFGHEEDIPEALNLIDKLSGE